MIFIKRWALLGILLMLSFQQLIFSQYPETIYGSDEGLTHNSVLNIQEDQQGFLWVNTFSGLCRFDGYNFKEYLVDGKRCDTNVGTVYLNKTDSQGRVWILTSFDRLLIYNIEEDKVQAIKNIDRQGTCLVDDGEDNYWLSTESDFLLMQEKDPYDFTITSFELPEEIGPIYRFYLQSDGSMIAISRSGYYYMDPHKENFGIQSIQLHINGRLMENNFDMKPTLIEISDKVFLYTLYGIYKTELSKSGPSFKDSILNIEPLNLHDPQIGLEDGDMIFRVIEGGSNEMFFRAEHGIYRYNLITEDIERIKEETYGAIDVGEGEFKSALFYDPDGILWAGTDHGLLKIVLPNKQFHSIIPGTRNAKGFKFAKLNQAVVDHKGDLWMGTVGDGLYHSVPDEYGGFSTFDHFMPVETDTASLHSELVSKLLEDSHNNLWIGGHTLQKKYTANKEIRFTHTPITHRQYYFNNYLTLASLVEDPYGNIVTSSILDDYSCYVIRPQNNEAYFVFLDSARKEFIRNPWFFTSENKKFYMFAGKCIYDLPDGWIFQDVDKQPDKHDPEFQLKLQNHTLIPWAYPAVADTLLMLDSLPHTYARFIVTDKSEEQELWLVPGADEGILRYKIAELEQADRSGNEKYYHQPMICPDDGNKLEYIYDLIEDNSGKIWCSTQNGLARIDPETNKANIFYTDDGLQTNKMYWGISRDKTGRIFVCTINGLLYFHPDSIVADPPPHIRLSEFRLFHQPVEVGEDGILNSSISQTDRLVLKYNQNYLGFKFTALEHRNTRYVKYKYILEGLDKNWIEADGRRQADYLNLRPGNYTFRIIACNGNGIWNTEGTSLDIRITQPPWFRWWAIIIEVLVILSIFISIIWYRERDLKQRALQLEVKVEEKTNQILEQRKEVDDMKSRFYTNISHEFRTPLTLLVGPIEDSLKSKEEDAAISKKILKIMLRNARRLQRLINQLLDISKLESGKMELQLVKANLSDFTRTIASSFLSLAESNHIEYKIEVGNHNEDVCFDADKIETVITNLLSNAFKFTPEGGKVSMILEFENSSRAEEDQHAIITVSDTGKGMELDQLDHIFERFYQVSNSDTRDVEGTGIGLALTKELVEFMHGEINVESAVGKGTTFRITFPVAESYFTEYEIAEMQSKEMIISDLDMDIDKHVGKVSPDEADTGEELILVVEDNPDLRKYISEQFRAKYRVMDAKNGKTGFEKAITVIPDLIITDLMMPVMGGMELCKKLKEHPVTNHIPVIMLTAKADKESKLAGLEAAADDYIIKPFDSEELLVRSKNLIRQRKELRKNFEQSYLREPEGTESASFQFKMLREFMKIFNAHIAEPEITVEYLAEKLNMSRSQLFRKINAVSGTTPNELMRMVRMKRAASLLRKGDLNVTQVMYQAGMKNPSYFAKSFKKYYGVNPRDYQNGK